MTLYPKIPSLHAVSPTLDRNGRPKYFPGHPGASRLDHCHYHSPRQSPRRGVLFYSFLYYLDIPVTAQVIGGLDKLIYAVYVDHPEEMDVGHIVHSIYLSRLFALNRAYSLWAWEHLQQGLGLLVSSNSDSMRIGSCAQLLGAGQRIRKWCAGGWLDNVNDCFLGKPKEPEGKKKFAELVSALDTPGEEAQSEWARAVLAVSAVISQMFPSR